MVSRRNNCRTSVGDPNSLKEANLTSWYNNDNNEDDEANDDAHPHLHVLPPHLLPDTVCSSAETLSGNR